MCHQRLEDTDFLAVNEHVQRVPSLQIEITPGHIIHNNNNYYSSISVR